MAQKNFGQFQISLYCVVILWLEVAILQSGYFASRGKIVFFLCLGLGSGLGYGLELMLGLGLGLEFRLGFGLGLNLGLFWHLRQNSH